MQQRLTSSTSQTSLHKKKRAERTKEKTIHLPYWLRQQSDDGNHWSKTIPCHHCCCSRRLPSCCGRLTERNPKPYSSSRRSCHGQSTVPRIHQLLSRLDASRQCTAKSQQGVFDEELRLWYVVLPQQQPAHQQPVWTRMRYSMGTMTKTKSKLNSRTMPCYRVVLFGILVKVGERDLKRLGRGRCCWTCVK